ncbi:conjugal transfer protein TraF [Pseudomonadota bacterium]
MRKKSFSKVLIPSLVLFSTQAAALPFQSLDPRSYGMGGTGVASGTSANAGFMNPALLAAAKEDEDFSLELPVIGGRLMDKDDLLDEIDAYQDGNLEGNLTSAVDTFSTTPSDANAAAVSTEAAALWNQLTKLANKAIQGEVSAGFVVGIPSKTLGASLTANVWAVGGGLLNVTPADDALVNGIVAAGNVNAAALAANPAISDQVLNGNDVVDKLTSGMLARGAVIQEVSIALAREVSIGGNDFALGITPKYFKVTTFDYSVDVNTADFDSDLGKKEYSDFNLDIGIAKDHMNGWKTGLVVKNVIAEEYQTVLGNTVKIEPQARAGVSHSTDWTTVALDVDLNESDAVGFDSKTQYVGLGAELDVFETVQLRVGYRHNMSDSDTSIATAGIGFAIFGAHADLSVGANEDEIGGSFQLGFRF